MKSKNAKSKIGRYVPAEIEGKWQQQWAASGLNYYPSASSGQAPKYYTLVELPYPSGDLHIGHWFTFASPDILSRYKRMQGFDVFFPMGYDAFGLPAENAAIKRDIHPQDWTMSNIKSMTRQFKTMGTMIDWDRVTITCLPEYYKWNQWIFIEMFKKGIAYRSKTLSNWCPVDQTVLANEHVENGRCWRCGAIVEQKEVEQWFLRITQYADQLLWSDQKVEWPNSVRVGQNDWIGKTMGTVIDFDVADLDCQIKVFTTRADTLYGATFLVLAPEHAIIEKITTKAQKDAVKKYQKDASRKTELERKEMKEKTGVFTGAYVKNPLSGEKMPVWIADYALIQYGTGALFGDAHDDRDTEFANKFGIPLKVTVMTGDKERDKKILAFKEVFTGYGTLIESGEFTGLSSAEGKAKVTQWLIDHKKGDAYVNYHLHDWSVSRQRYWGTPVPMIHCADCGIVPVPEKDLPVELPYNVDYTPKGKPPLASNEEWLAVKCPKCGKQGKRDAETLDTFFDSSWYYYRYVDPEYTKAPFDSELVEGLMPLDIYFGGAEHTLGHTLYARFFTKFFKDLGLISFDEFALKRIQHGIVLGPDGNKMSKSKGNVINPDAVVDEFGADAVRIYLAFMMPYEATGPWSTGAMYGMFRFLKRVWEMSDKVVWGPAASFPPASAPSSRSVRAVGSPSSGVTPNLSGEDLRLMHTTIKRVTEDVEQIKMNTAIARLMEWLNYLTKKTVVSMEEYKTFLLLLAPFAPHMTEEIWQRLKNENHKSIHTEAWPTFDEKYLVSDEVTIVIQVNGKVRDNISVQRLAASVQEDIEKIAKGSEKIKKYLDGKETKKVIYIKGKLINFVVN